MQADLSQPADRELVVRLYVAGRAPDSARAMANLDSIINEFAQITWQVEIVDVLVEPLRALTDGVLVTPTLIRVTPRPEVWIVGDLSREAEVSIALGLGSVERGSNNPLQGE
jgi:circadian clock protein KaiB